MRIEQLSAFVHVKERKSFTRAAEDLFLSQAAVYQQVRQLERDVGTPLVHVVGKEVRVTAAGEHVYEFGKSVAEGFDRLKTTLEGLRSNEGHLVRFGGSSFLGTVAVAAERVRAKLPDCIIEFRTVRSPVAVELVRRGEIDFAFLGVVHVPDDLDAEPCGFNQIVPVVVPSHPLAGRRRVSPREFFSYPLITYAGGNPRAAVDEWLRQNGISGVNFAAKSDTSTSIKAMAVGLGAPALVVREAAYHELVNGVLVEVPVAGLAISYDVYALYRRENLSRTGVQVLHELRAIHSQILQGRPEFSAHG